MSAVRAHDGRSVSYVYTSGRLTSVSDVRGRSGRTPTTLVASCHDRRPAEARAGDERLRRRRSRAGADGRRRQEDRLRLGRSGPRSRPSPTRTATPGGTTTTRASSRRRSTPLARHRARSRRRAEHRVRHLADRRGGADVPRRGREPRHRDRAALPRERAEKTFAYNSRNDPTQVTDARSKVTSYTYDASGNAATVSQDGVRVASYTYDAAGRVSTSTDGNEKRRRTPTSRRQATSPRSPTRSGTRRPTRTTTPAAWPTSRPEGNVSGCGCATQFTWSYSYNAAGQQLTETDPLGHTTTDAYDDAGRLKSSTDANGHTTSYTYDDANRVLTETGPDPDGAGPLAAPVTTYTYDDVGNRRTETDPRGSTTKLRLRRGEQARVRDGTGSRRRRLARAGHDVHLRPE